MSIKVLELCHKHDEIKTEKILIKKIPEFRSVTLVQIAIFGNLLDFVSHQCFQSLIAKIWYHKFVPDSPRTRV